MDRQGPPNRPGHQLPGGLNWFRQRKRCYEATLCKQEGSTMRHMANAQYWTGLPVIIQDDFSCHLAGWSVLTSVATVHWVGCINEIKIKLFTSSSTSFLECEVFTRLSMMALNGLCLKCLLLYSSCCSHYPLTLLLTYYIFIHLVLLSDCPN